MLKYVLTFGHSFKTEWFHRKSIEELYCRKGHQFRHFSYHSQLIFVNGYNKNNTMFCGKELSLRFCVTSRQLTILDSKIRFAFFSKAKSLNVFVSSFLFFQVDFLLEKISEKYDESNTGLCRDDGWPVSKNKGSNQFT